MLPDIKTRASRHFFWNLSICFSFTIELKGKHKTQPNVFLDWRWILPISCLIHLFIHKHKKAKYIYPSNIINGFIKYHIYLMALFWLTITKYAVNLLHLIRNFLSGLTYISTYLNRKCGIYMGHIKWRNILFRVFV